MTRRHLAAAGAVLALASCHRPAPVPPANPHYVLGNPYQQAGQWWYPQDRTQYQETGLATVMPAAAGLTIDGERIDATALTGAHHTLQLPAIVRVTNLDNGLQVLVRLNDRGPDAPGRLIGLSRHAAALLGASDGTQVRVELDGAMSQALTDQLGGGPRLAIVAVPRGDVAAEALPPPPGTGQSSRGRLAPSAIARTQSYDAVAARVPDRLPDEVTQAAPQPGQIFLRADEFSQASYANRQAAMLAGIGGRVEYLRDGRTTRYRVKAGPFTSAADADAALDQARRVGVIDSQIVVE